MVIILFFSLISISSHLASQEDLGKIALDGYNELRQGNHDEAHKLFKETLILASKSSWPTYNYKKINKVLPKFIEEHRYDWQGTRNQKILGLMQVYNSVKHNFAGFGIIAELNWDELVIEYIPEVIEAKSMEEYYKLLRKLIASLNDNHTYIVTPESIQEKIDRPPISIEFIENKFIITQVDTLKEIMSQNIYPGLEIKEVEGVLAKEFFVENILPYMPLSKVQRERLYSTSNLLSGEINSKVKIVTVDLNGKEREAVLTRNAKIYKKEEELPVVQVEELEPGIVYFNFMAFKPWDTAVQKFEQEFNKLDLSKIKGVVLDVRYNRGGNSVVGDVIVSHIIDKPVKAWLFKARKNGFLKVAHPFVQLAVRIMSIGKEWFEWAHKIKPCSGKRYSGAVAVLISRYTGSAAEDFVAAIRESKRAVIIGETTSGGTGNGLLSILPGYGKLRVCVNIGAYINGDIWQGIGIEPDIEVPRTVEDVYRRHDSVLAKGLEALEELQQPLREERSNSHEY